jgi:diguanylate cyclase (GGDEF)-like protein/PAS domain S-box-containing protein
VKNTPSDAGSRTASIAMPAAADVSIATPIAVGAVIALCCWLSIHFMRQPDRLSTLWVASGVLAGVLATSARSTWRASVLAAFVANVIVRACNGDAWYSVLGLGVASTLDAFLLALALVYFVGDVTDPAKATRAARMVVISALVACAVSGAIVAAVLAVAGAPASSAVVFINWLTSHTLGMVVFSTLTVVARGQGMRLLGRPEHRVGLAISIALTAITSLAVFSQSRYPLLFLVYLPLLLNVLQHRFSGVFFGVTVVTAITIVETLLGHGPFLLIPNAGPTERALLLQLFIAGACVVALPVAVVLTERRFLEHRLRDGERRYRMLADYSRDLVVRIAADGRRLYVSPSAKDLLGWDVNELVEPRTDLLHPDDVAMVTQALDALYATGISSTFTYRARHRHGHYVWIEARARRVPSIEGGSQPEIIYSGRDVTHRVEAERALAENQRRLHAITDNLPAFVMHMDVNEIFTFANAPTLSGMGFGADIVGRSVRDVAGVRIYAEIKPKIDRALGGERVSFEIEREFSGQQFHYQSTYVPEVDSDGNVIGIYVMSSDISQLKRTEQELMLLARFDGLSGLANRFHFNESADMAVARHQRSARPLALLYVDIDYFKRINDGHGHAVGDGVLAEFAQRLKGCLRVTDFAARLGGDEFVVLVEDVDTPEIPEIIARKMIAAMQVPIVVGALELNIKTSIGIAFCSRIVVSRDDLLHIADGALYAAKAAGRNCCRTTVMEDPDLKVRLEAS